MPDFVSSMRAAAALCVFFWASQAYAGMQVLQEDEMAGVTGAGIAFTFEDFRMLTKPTSYFENLGSTPSVTDWRRADLRWYGWNISGAGPGGFHWNESVGGFGTACDASQLSCPRGPIMPVWAAHDNPYILRAFSPLGRSFDGTVLNSDINNPDKTIYEFLAPTAQPVYTYSFWGELEVGKGQGLPVTESGTLKTQTLIRGNAAGSIFRLFQFTEPGNETFGIFYHSQLTGDFRFSATQFGTVSDTIGVPPRFDGNEGLHFKNVDAFIPLGQLYYQALTIDAVGTDGNFKLEIPRLPNTASVWGDFYALRTGDQAGYETARRALSNDFSGNNSGLKNYSVSHGHSRWGDWYPNCRYVTGNFATGCMATTGTRNAYNASDDGIYFRRCSSCANISAYARRMTRWNVEDSLAYYTGYVESRAEVSGGRIASEVVNIGDARVDGMLINSLRFETCMGSPTC